MTLVSYPDIIPENYDSFSSITEHTIRLVGILELIKVSSHFYKSYFCLLLLIFVAVYQYFVNIIMIE